MSARAAIAFTTSAQGKHTMTKTSKSKSSKKAARSFVDKLRPELEPKIVKDKKSGLKMLVPTPLLVATMVSRVAPRKLTSPERIRRKLARKFGAKLTCPMTTAIFLNILAGAAEEELAAGQAPTAPYWRVVNEDGTLPAKFPPGPQQQAKRLEAEGHEVVRGSKGQFTVLNCNKRFVQLGAGA